MARAATAFFTFLAIFFAGQAPGVTTAMSSARARACRSIFQNLDTKTANSSYVVTDVPSSD
eukprot:COSAG05_NODE_2200_length_3407_cov_25.853109_3_plen_61_part_00